jgi:LPXTG-motif cell wall-anchored protein
MASFDGNVLMDLTRWVTKDATGAGKVYSDAMANAPTYTPQEHFFTAQTLIPGVSNDRVLMVAGFGVLALTGILLLSGRKKK